MAKVYNLIESLSALALSSDLAEFMDLQPGHYLLGDIPEDEDSSTEFHTAGISQGDLKKIIEEVSALGDKNFAEKHQNVLDGGAFLVVIEKHAKNAWTEWVSVGRTTNNDIVLVHSSVSKLHARIRVEEPPLGSETPNQYWLTDLDSKNGTRVNNQVLTPREDYLLNVSDIIEFGQVKCRFLNAARLYQGLRSDRTKNGL